jgi:hypothetical protein
MFAMNCIDELKVIETVSNTVIESAAIDYVPFSDIVWQSRSLMNGVALPMHSLQLRSLSIAVTKRLLEGGISAFQFEKDSQGQFVIVLWSSQQPEGVQSRILAERDLLATDPNPGDICWFKR